MGYHEQVKLLDTKIQDVKALIDRDNERLQELEKQRDTLTANPPIEVPLNIIRAAHFVVGRYSTESFRHPRPAALTEFGFSGDDYLMALYDALEGTFIDTEEGP